MPGVLASLPLLNRRLAALIRVVVTAAVTGMLVALALQVFMRYVLGKALAWSEELSLLLFSWTMLLTLALGVREGFHVRIAGLVERLGPAATQVFRLVDAAVLFAGGYLCWSGIQYVIETSGSTSAAIAYPIEFLYTAAPISGLVIALFALERLIDPPAPAAATQQEPV